MGWSRGWSYGCPFCCWNKMHVKLVDFPLPTFIGDINLDWEELATLSWQMLKDEKDWWQCLFVLFIPGFPKFVKNVLSQSFTCTYVENRLFYFSIKKQRKCEINGLLCGKCRSLIGCSLPSQGWLTLCGFYDMNGLEICDFCLLIVNFVDLLGICMSVWTAWLVDGCRVEGDFSQPLDFLEHETQVEKCLKYDNVFKNFPNWSWMTSFLAT